MPVLFPVFKYTVYTLLALNIYLFFRHATFHEGLDSIGWVMLLATFEWETRKEDEVSQASTVEKSTLITLQLIPYALILYAWVNYYLHAQWLDLVNASLWLLVVLMLSIDVYAHAARWRAHPLHRAAKFALYAALLVVAIIWGVQGDILNFYDAFLWIVCFFAIEMNLWQHIHHWRLARRRLP